MLKLTNILLENPIELEEQELTLANTLKLFLTEEDLPKGWKEYGVDEIPAKKKGARRSIHTVPPTGTTVEPAKVRLKDTHAHKRKYTKKSDYWKKPIKYHTPTDLAVRPAGELAVVPDLEIGPAKSIDIEDADFEEIPEPKVSKKPTSPRLRQSNLDVTKHGGPGWVFYSPYSKKPEHSLPGALHKALSSEMWDRNKDDWFADKEKKEEEK